MAWFEARFFSETLRLATAATVVVPQRSAAGQIGVETGRARSMFPVVYLLHGLSDDHSIWGRRTCVERYAEALGLAVVMPEVHRSFYLNTASGLPYFSYITGELPVRMREFFPLSDKVSETFVAGFSMGGYGAFRAAFLRPDVFGAAASLSGVMDVEGCLGQGLLGEEEERAVFGADLAVAGTDRDLFHLASSMGRGAGRLLQVCGHRDFLVEENRRFRDHLAGFGLNWRYEEVQGEHNWDFVERTIPAVLQWFASGEWSSR